MNLKRSIILSLENIQSIVRKMMIGWDSITYECDILDEDDLSDQDSESNLQIKVVPVVSSKKEKTQIQVVKMVPG